MENVIRFLFNTPHPDIPNNFYGIYSVYSDLKDFNVLEHEQFICRFCGTNDKKKFKARAHIVPEFTGNVNMVSNFECDDCNNKFSIYETSLSMLGGIRDSMSLIKSKHKYPKYKDTKNNLVVHYDKGILKMIIDKDNPKIDFANNKLKIETNRPSYIPRYVIKSLAKIAICLLKEKDVILFKKTIKWLATPKDNLSDDAQNYMVLYGNEIRPPVQRPSAILMRKKVVYDAPEFCIIFRYGFHIYQMFLPFCELDKNISNEILYHPIESPNVLQKKEFVRYEKGSTNGTSSQNQRWKCSLKWKIMDSIEKQIGETDEFTANIRGEYF